MNCEQPVLRPWSCLSGTSDPLKFIGQRNIWIFKCCLLSALMREFFQNNIQNGGVHIHITHTWKYVIYICVYIYPHIQYKSACCVQHLSGNTSSTSHSCTFQAFIYLRKRDDCVPELLSKGEALKLLHCSPHKHLSTAGQQRNRVMEFQFLLLHCHC